MHLEGLLIDGPYVADGIGIATGRNVQIQNVRVERAYDNVKNAHADCVQIQQGVGHLRMDGFTCTTERQGIFLGDHDGADSQRRPPSRQMYGAPGQAPALADDAELRPRRVRRLARHIAGLQSLGAFRLLGLSTAGR